MKETFDYSLDDEEDDFELHDDEPKLQESTNFQDQIDLNQPEFESSTTEILKFFYSNMPPWGGNIVSLESITNSMIYSNFNIVNTCSFDYLLYGLWISFKLSKKVIAFYKQF